jgi:hypothetical protein
MADHAQSTWVGSRDSRDYVWRSDGAPVRTPIVCVFTEESPAEPVRWPDDLQPFAEGG